LIVVDDGSNPPVSEKVFAGCPSGLSKKLLRNDSPKGANNARNRGIRAARGEWIAFLDDDDEFFPEKIEVVSKAINKKVSPVDVIYHPAHIFMVNEGVSYISKPTGFSPEDDVFRKLLIKNHIGGTPMVVVKKAALLNVGLFDEALQSLQDYELWLRLAKNNQSFHFLNSVLTRCQYITKKKSISKSLKVNRESVKFIEKKYADDYRSLLNNNDKKLHRAWVYDMQIHKSYLNKNYWRPVLLNLKALHELKMPKYLYGTFISFLGAKNVFKLRALISKPKS